MEGNPGGLERKPESCERELRFLLSRTPLTNGRWVLCLVSHHIAGQSSSGSVNPSGSLPAAATDEAMAIKALLAHLGPDSTHTKTISK